MNGPVDIKTGQPVTPLSKAAGFALRDDRREARSLYWRGWALQQISDELGVNYDTLASWKRRDGWDKAHPRDRISDRIEARISMLIDKEQFTEGDMKRVDFMMRQLERMARIEKYSGVEGRETDLNPKIKARNDEKAVAKRSAKKNFLSAEDIQKCRDLFNKELGDWQRPWWEASGQVFRFILKSRQIGATWYFAREAFLRAMETGNNQIFMSASLNQALIFAEYIRDFVYLATGVELTGSKRMVVNRGGPDGEKLPPVTFYCLGSNFRTAQGFHGDVYLDECFWLPGFEQFEAAASAMASQKIYRLTYFSTPSTIQHEAHVKWSGQAFNAGRPRGEQVKFDTSHAALKDGLVGADGIWRQIVTLDDAIAKGFDLIDRAEMERRYSPEHFRNKYLCEFLDDSASSFPFAMLKPCMVDSFYRWRDFSPALVNIPGARPFGEKDVWIGVDPNNEGEDNAAVCVLAAPDKPGGLIRVLEKHRFTGEDFEGQAKRVREIFDRYNVSDISVDGTGGMGKAVAELIKKWFPGVRLVMYSVATKSAMVLKGQNVMRNKRLQFDASWNDVVAAFLSIRPALSASGKQVTHVTARGDGVGHGDIAWAILQALSNEPFDASEPTRGGGSVSFLD